MNKVNKVIIIILGVVLMVTGFSNEASGITSVCCFCGGYLTTMGIMELVFPSKD